MVWDQELQHRVMDRPPYGFEGKRKSPQFARFQKGDFLKKAGFLNQTGAQPRPESVKQIKKVILGRQSFSITRVVRFARHKRFLG